jgi:murein DD-endopeptidase MepM/ murein hydrolase activator NlpD
LKARWLGVALALAAVVLATTPAQAVTRVRYYPPPPPPDYRAPIAVNLAANQHYALQTRDQVDASLAANAVEHDRLRADLADGGSARNEAARISQLHARLAVLAGVADRLQRRHSELDALGARGAGQSAALYGRPLEDGQRDADQLARDLTAAVGAGLQAVTDEARQAVVNRRLDEVPSFDWPEAGFEVTQEWGPSDLGGEPPFQGYEHFHMGIDLGAPDGTAVTAPADGVVVLVGPEESLGRYFGYGNHILIAHGAQVDTVYGHLAEVDVRAGDTVHRGQRIGLQGSTGYSTGPHLHFEVHAAGQPVDPAFFLKAR